MEHRLQSRAHLKTWVRVIPPAGHGLLGNIEDISTGGLGVLHDRPMPIDTECNVYFMLPLGAFETIVQARCRIAACHQQDAACFHIGLQFLDFVTDTREAQDAIHRFQHQLQTAGR
ncbi:PilZ domain-containing protein [Chitinivorax sp. PXF-14]|uniref:PilZ domain-containing protein n=1 Tax=Chitinivorax sp. PXF-14 TaxID=3230488 RepID=UPI003467C2D5